MIPVLAAQAPDRLGLVEGGFAHAVLARIDFHHQEEGEIEQHGRDHRHQQHIEVRDLQELGDQESSRAQHRWRNDRPQATCGEQAAGGVFLVAGLGQHRVGHGAQRDRGGHARPGGATQQKRGQHHGAAGAGGLAPHGGEREVDIELARARVLQESAEDREQDDQRRRHIHGDAVDALQGHVHHPHQAADLVALVGPRRRQVGSEQGIGDEGCGDDRHDPAVGAAHGFEHHDDERYAEGDVPRVGRGVAVGEVIAALQQVDHDRNRACGGQPVPPHDAMAKAGAGGKHQEAQEQHKADVDWAQGLRGHDAVGGVEVERRHREGHRDDEDAQPALELVGSARLGLDEFFGLVARFVADGNGGRVCCRGGKRGRRGRDVTHAAGPCASGIRAAEKRTPFQRRSGRARQLLGAVS